MAQIKSKNPRPRAGIIKVLRQAFKGNQGETFEDFFGELPALTAQQVRWLLPENATEEQLEETLAWYESAGLLR